MPLKIIHRTENNAEKTPKIELNSNIEETIQKMFYLCKKIIDICQNIIKETDFQNILQSENFEEFEIMHERVDKIMSLFSLVFGKKIAIIDAIVKTTAIMQKIRVLSDSFEVKLINTEENDSEVLTDEDVEMMVQMVKDFGEDKIKEDARKCKNYLNNQKHIKNITQNQQTDVYEIYNDSTKKLDT